jgi:hypothetical protein
MPKQNVINFTIVTMEIFCPVDDCKRKYAGKEREVNHLMKLHIKKSHNKKTITHLGANIVDTRKLYKGEQRSDTEMLEKLKEILPINSTNQ